MAKHRLFVNGSMVLTVIQTLRSDEFAAVARGTRESYGAATVRERVALFSRQTTRLLTRAAPLAQFRSLLLNRNDS